MIDNHAITFASLELHHGISAKNFQHTYKHHLSEYSKWDQEDKQEVVEGMIIQKNISAYMGIDEVCLSNGELYTILLNKTAKGKKRSIVAILKGTKSEDIIKEIRTIPKNIRDRVKEVTADLSPSMNLIIKRCFANADITLDRFHVQQMASEAVQKIRIQHRWTAIDQENAAIREARKQKQKFEPVLCDNGDTKKQLLARSRHLIFKPSNKWTPSQVERAGILFKEFPDIKRAYDLSMSLRNIFEQRISPGVALTKLAQWYDKADKSGFSSFESIKNTFFENSAKIANYFKYRSSNAASESFNAKLKNFRKDLRGVSDLPYMLFRITTVFG